MIDSNSSKANRTLNDTILKPFPKNRMLPGTVNEADFSFTSKELAYAELIASKLANRLNNSVSCAATKCFT